MSRGLFWRDILKVAKNFLGPEMPLSAFWCGKYDVTSQKHSWLLSFLSIEKQDTLPGRSEKEANYWLPFSTNQRRASTNTRATSPSAPEWNVLFRWEMANALGKTATVVVNTGRKRLSKVSFLCAHRKLRMFLATWTHFLWKCFAKISLRCHGQF